MRSTWEPWKLHIRCCLSFFPTNISNSTVKKRTVKDITFRCIYNGVHFSGIGWSETIVSLSYFHDFPKITTLAFIPGLVCKNHLETCFWMLSKKIRNSDSHLSVPLYLSSMFNEFTQIQTSLWIHNLVHLQNIIESFSFQDNEQSSAFQKNAKRRFLASRGSHKIAMISRALNNRSRDVSVSR